MTTTDPIQNRPATNSRSLLHDASLTFAAGAFGGLLNSLTVWIFGAIDITGLLGVKIAPAFTPAWLYPRIVWGGLWGFLFLLPLPFLAGKSAWIRGLVLSLVPALVQLLLVFPVKDGKAF